MSSCHRGTRTSATVRRSCYTRASTPAALARTHGTPRAALDALPLEDLLVITADAVWKGRRDESLDDALVLAVRRTSGMAAWEVFATLDTILASVTDDADRRLAWQARFAATR